VLADIVTITGRSVCSANRYCDNNGNNGGGLHAVLTVIVTTKGCICAVLAVIVTIMKITGRSIESVTNYFDNNVEVYVQC